jgi:mRNA-degrading endonuclease RelE of RelBE toxin-antitoxin system
MDFRIADTFTDSLARLTGEEQKAVKTTAFDLQMNPVNSGMSLHKLDKAKDKNFWSLRVSADIRIIVHRTAGSLLLCYVDHHDKAYDWAQRRKLETHPKTGAAQLVEIRETVKEITVPVYVEAKVQKPASTPKTPLAHLTEDDLLGYGVPPEWVADVLQATEDGLLQIVERLPAEAAEALLELATGGRPVVSKVTAPVSNPFEHPDAQRRFRVMTNVEELQQALDFPWDKWTVFLHPEQRQLVERNYTGPARVSGSAGTGKTIVALHRAVWLARKHPDCRVLLTTFSHILANALRTRLKRLISNDPRLAERLEVHSINAIAARLHKSHLGAANLVSRETLGDILKEASAAVDGHKFSLNFLHAEWDQVVDAWQLDSWEAYRDVARLGRKTRLPEPQRKVLWEIFEGARAALAKKGLITQAAMFNNLARVLNQAKNPPFDFVVVDESQDMGVPQMRLFASMGRHRADALFFAGDLGQRIFQQPFSWLALDVDIRGRSKSLKVNYRTSHQIRMQADRLLGPEAADVDGNVEQRGAVSVFNGPVPEVKVLPDNDTERAEVAGWIAARLKEGMAPHEVGIFVRSEAQVGRAEAAAKAAQLKFKVLDENVETVSGYGSISTMHLAKGLEFRAVVVMACDDEVIPLQERISEMGDDADLKEIYDTERHLLYVACTRTRDRLLVTSVEPASEFLDDFKSAV